MNRLAFTSDIKFTTTLFYTYLIITITLLSGCQSPSISEEQAIAAVKTQHEQNNSFGEIDIISVNQKQGEYAVKWERKSNCETGIDFVSALNGKINHGVHSIC